MKIKRDRLLSDNNKRQLEILSHYHHVDYANQIVTMEAHFNHVNEVLTNYLGDKNHPVFSEDFLSKVSSFADSVPYPFKINVHLKIDNYASYSPTSLMNSLQDTLETFNYSAKKSQNLNKIKMSLLIAAGIVIFAWLFYFCSFKLFGDDDIMHDTVHEIVYTVACVLLWEGIYILFLPSQEYHDISYLVLKKINYFALLNKQNKTLIKRSMDELKKDWIHESKLQQRFRRLFLITATGYICLALCGLPEIIAIILNVNNSLLNIPILVISFALIVLLCLSSFANIAFYNGSGPLRSKALPLNIISLIILTADLAIHISNVAIYHKNNIFLLVANAILVIIAIISVIGLAIFHKKKKI